MDCEIKHDFFGDVSLYSGRDLIGRWKLQGVPVRMFAGSLEFTDTTSGVTTTAFGSAIIKGRCYNGSCQTPNIEGAPVIDLMATTVKAGRAKGKSA